MGVNSLGWREKPSLLLVCLHAEGGALCFQFKPEIRCMAGCFQLGHHQLVRMYLCISELVFFSATP